VAAEMPDIQVTDRSLIFNTDLVDTLELDNLMAQAIAAMSLPIARRVAAPMPARTTLRVMIETG